jgi:hypothetical protein
MTPLFFDLASSGWPQESSILLTISDSLCVDFADEDFNFWIASETRFATKSAIKKSLTFFAARRSNLLLWAALIRLKTSSDTTRMRGRRHVRVISRIMTILSNVARPDSRERLSPRGPTFRAFKLVKKSLWYGHGQQTLWAFADFYASHFAPRARVDDGGVIATTVAHRAVVTIRRKGDPVGAFSDVNLG